MGKTRVLCAASVSDDPPRWLRGTGKGWVTGEYSMLPASTSERSAREVTRGRPGGRTQEIQRLIGRALRSVTDLRAIGERMVTIDCDVLQADAGTRTASITGGYVALALALRGQGVEEALRDSVAAVSVGLVDGEPRLDLCYEEDAGAEVDCNIVMTGNGAARRGPGHGGGRTVRSRAARCAARPRHVGDRRADEGPAGGAGGPVTGVPPRIALATRNPHKLRELARICADWPTSWVSVETHDPSAFPDVEETGDTYLENARLKARGGGGGSRSFPRSPTTPGSRSTPWAASRAPGAPGTRASTPPTRRTCER